ncbi:MAG TPA: hypothetical protein ENK99_07810 [Campylobacterales bacterium]|nr:hypothetical protein [Campylobacterales bacterium]HHH51707.1 hypothetical protein [Campylobacterales bacterium]
MILRLIIFAIIGAVIYRFLGGKLPFIDRDKSSKKEKSDDDFTKVAPTSQCAMCGTYMTEDDAIIYQKKSYCSKECLDKAQKR